MSGAHSPREEEESEDLFAEAEELLSPSLDALLSPISSPPSAPTYAQSFEGLKRLKKYYPYVDTDQLPKHWSSKDKPNFITLSEDGLKVHYKGTGKTHKDAAAVRATHPIPPSCLLYYYEVKIISKGRDGYMGIGLAAQGVSMNRLPGWDKQSYGYHGDDGHSFNSSGTGQPYGPTFTTGDIIGCGYNLIENNCFYTKNGVNLGVAFTDLPSVQLFPTVGLQTPGEELEANFGLEPFVYEIEQEFVILRKSINTSIRSFPVNYSEWTPMLHELVRSWIIHNGCYSAAQIFSENTHIPFTEDVTKIKRRLKIQKLVLSGRISEAISLTKRYHPSVLENDQNLLFLLNCRQFIEYICGNDSFASGESSNGNSEFNGNSNDNLMDIDEGIGGETGGTSFDATSPEVHSENGNSVDGAASSVENIERIINFGKELNAFSQELISKQGDIDTNRQMLDEAFRFIGYLDPKDKKNHENLVYLDRELVCQQLNKAIIKSETNSSKVPIEIALNQLKAVVELNNHCGAWLLDKL